MPGKMSGSNNSMVTASALGHPSFTSNAVTTSLNIAPPANNEIVSENRNPGNPATEWDISGSGDASIQGFATDFSVNRGSTVYFKVNTNAGSYRLDIYRMGYYQGNGARKVATINASAALPQTQPPCLTNSATGLIDCGNWAVSASWAVPSNATSGIYFAKAVRTDTGGASHIFFIVRNDASTSDILFQTSDTTWQAYNDWGGKSLYGCGDWNLNCRAYKVSYNRPFHTRVFNIDSWVFNGEYPMVRWLEANGYDVTYFSGIDTDRIGALLKNHKVWMSNGHDEYWSGGQRANVEAALEDGIHLAFFSGNKIFWKTRWENSIDGLNTPYRTLVCYKETHANAVIDPMDPPVWTGTWRDPRFSPPADGGRPENALGGTIFRINGTYNNAITVPQADGRMRFWRNTSVATLGAGQTATLAPGSLGAEVDVDEDNGFRPAGLFGLSTNVITTDRLYLLNYGSTYGAGTATHKLTLYRHASGALVFASGSYQWSWGLDASHDRISYGSTTDIRMQQATVNLFADMEVQPETLQTGLVPAFSSTDFTPPISTVTSPLTGSAVNLGSTITFTGIASDTGGGVVGGVEISTDGGATWHPAAGRENWQYTWTADTAGTKVVRTRSVDDSGNLENPSGGITLIVPSPSYTSLWPDTAIPAMVDAGLDDPVELGVKFRADADGLITGIRYYKASTNTGTHVGNLWTLNGQLLASATFTNETSSGWQQVYFTTPVAITANTIYVASYHTEVGHYSADRNYFSGKGVDSPPLHAPADGLSGFNGPYAYGAAGTFPNQGYSSSNYWVDVAFNVIDTCTETGYISIIPGQTLSGNPIDLTSIVTENNATNVSYTVLEADACPAQTSVPLIAKRSIWKYNVENTGTTWMNTGYDDSGWLTGAGMFGTDPTISSFISTPISNTNLSMFFRKTFSVCDPSKVTALTLDASFDDGMVVYINGTQVYIQGVTGNPPPYNGLAVGHGASSANQPVYETKNLAGMIGLSALKNLLVSGSNNVIAVGVYNVSAASSDIVWDGALVISNDESSDILFTGDNIQSGFVDTTGWTEGEKSLEITGDDAVCITPLVPANDTFYFQ